MNRNKILGISNSVALASLLLVGSPAFALFDGELSVGQRTGTWKTSGDSGKSLSSSTIELAAHLDPIPLVPVSFGVRFISDAYDAKIADHGIKSLTSTAIVPEVTAWLPLGDLKPFGRIGYTAASAYKGTAETTVAGASISGSVAYQSTGPRIAAGVEWSLLPLVSLTAAYELSTETISMSEGKIGSVDIKTGAKDINFVSTAILIGAKAGL